MSCNKFTAHKYIQVKVVIRNTGEQIKRLWIKALGEHISIVQMPLIEQNDHAGISVNQSQILTAKAVDSDPMN